MSVYKRQGEETYSYDFQRNGIRYSGNTGATSKREAEREEKKIRDSIPKIAKLRAKTAPKTKMTFGEACARYYMEVSQFNAAPDTALADFALLEKRIGKHKDISEISSNDVAMVIAKRRGDCAKGTKRLVTNGTVNKSVTKRLSAVLNRASNVWEIPTRRIKWGDHLLPETQERIRELSTDEETKLFSHIRYDYQPIAYFLLRMGCRRNEAVNLAWRDIDWGNGELRVIGKGNKMRFLPMPEDVYMLLYNLPRADLDHVFTYVVQRGRYKGELRPITPEGFKTQFSRDKGKTDIVDFKMHDLRHTAATRIMRAKGNLKLVQRILGHSNIETTTRYAHVVKNDILDGFEATSPTKSPTDNIIKKINDKIQGVK